MSMQPATAIAIAITTYNRSGFLADTLERILALRPEGCPVIVVDDGSAVPVAVPREVTLYRFDSNQGIATAKNKCLELLCETRAQHFFLFDDDTYPTASGWWEPYVNSDQPHLMYNFAQGPDHWVSHQIGSDGYHRAFQTPRGCMLYVQRHVLDAVGGMHTAFGKHGGEHGDWSTRIHRAGLTWAPFADVPQPAIHCRDQDDSGISSVDYREHQQWRSVDPDALPQFAPFRGRIPVLVPRRADNGWRDRLWDTLRQDYWARLPGFELIEGEHRDGVFNRSAAINVAASEAGDWELAIIADADTLVAVPQLQDAVALARRTQRLVAAFHEVHELSERATRWILEDTEARDEAGLSAMASVSGCERVRRGSDDPTTVQSSMLVVPRAVWDAVGGFDEKFVGWGCEDNAFWRACELLTGEPKRVHGPAWHLWHPSGRPANAADLDYQRNQWRYRLYANALCAEDVRRLRAGAAA